MPDARLWAVLNFCIVCLIDMSPPAHDVAPTVLVIVGTRPEAIKVAPIVLAAQQAKCEIRLQIVATQQHGAVVIEALHAFGLCADYTLECPRPTGSLPELLSVLVEQVGTLLARVQPAAVVVQGDTSSALAGALAGFYAGLPVVHVEAGLSSGALATPFPEEAHRRLISDIATLHLAPTDGAAANLFARGVDSADVIVTGNTVVDAVTRVALKAASSISPQVAEILSANRRLVVVTVHRRESWGRPMQQIARALTTLCDLHSDLHVLVVRHPNPNAAQTLSELLTLSPQIECINPLPYAAFIGLLSRACLVLTDSGGLQEELPTLGVRTVVLRAETERPEALLAGLATLAGTDHDRIVEAATAALVAEDLDASAVNPFGDGRAGDRSAQAIAWLLGRATKPDDYRVAEELPGSVADGWLDSVVMPLPSSP